ncbi:UNVERIFIED_CONTAM: hypothetical protein FKN15_029270 [Acipenser sinensis]
MEQSEQAAPELGSQEVNPVFMQQLRELDIPEEAAKQAILRTRNVSAEEAAMYYFNKLENELLGDAEKVAPGKRLLMCFQSGTKVILLTHAVRFWNILTEEDGVNGPQLLGNQLYTAALASGVQKTLSITGPFFSVQDFPKCLLLRLPTTRILIAKRMFCLNLEE